jgi:hypothetical protein
MSPGGSFSACEIPLIIIARSTDIVNPDRHDLRKATVQSSELRVTEALRAS